MLRYRMPMDARSARQPTTTSSNVAAKSPVYQGSATSRSIPAKSTSLKHLRCALAGRSRFKSHMFSASMPIIMSHASASIVATSRARWSPQAIPCNSNTSRVPGCTGEPTSSLRQAAESITNDPPRPRRSIMSCITYWAIVDLQMFPWQTNRIFTELTSPPTITLHFEAGKEMKTFL